MGKVPKRICRIAEFLLNNGGADEWETFLRELSDGDTVTTLTEYKKNVEAAGGR